MNITSGMTLFCIDTSFATILYLLSLISIPSGVVTTFAGQASAGLVDDVGTNAQFYYPVGMDMDYRGYLYVADGGQYGGPGANSGNNAIRYIKPSGM